jgi:hypothetical protein
MTFSASEIRNGVTDNGYVLLFSQADIDAQPLKAIVLDSDGEAAQKDTNPSPFRTNLNPEHLWFIAGHAEPQSPRLPAALVWDPTMISARKVLAGR